MEERFQNHTLEVSRMNSEELRKAFTLTGLMQTGKLQLIYSHYDRMIIGGVVPENEAIVLNNYTQLKTNFFLERREMGIMNIGYDGTIRADGIDYYLAKSDCPLAWHGYRLIKSLNNTNEMKSTQRCTISDDWAYKGMKVFFLENEFLRIGILANRGGLLKFKNYYNKLS